MEEHNLQAVLLKSPPNVYYLSGFTGTNAILLITMTHSYLLTDFRYLEQAAQQAGSFEIIRVDNELPQAVSKLTPGLKNIGIEEDILSWAEFRSFQTALSGCDLLDASDILRELRQVKEPEEIEIIRQVIHITDQAFSSILDKIRPGIAEEQLGLELEFALRQRGASGRSFDFIVASGERSALPHGVASTKEVAEGELVTLDFGAVYKMYCSDLTRTVCLGRSDARQEEIYSIVLEAQQAAITGLKPGMTGKEADAIAREVISKAGYGEYFGHGLGHALGLEIHEKPRLNTRETQIMQPGMVVTVEPGIYIPGWGGVRIEDVVLVTDFGVEVLTQAPKQFIIID